MKPLKISARGIAFLLLAPFPAAAQTNHFVWRNSPAPAAPYTNWATAAHDIQSAIDASANGDIVWVTNGLYDAGGRTNAHYAAAGQTNRVVITNAVTLISVNGPGVTAIKGARDPAATNGPAAVRCVFIYPGAKLIGFTLTNGATLSTGRGGGILIHGSVFVSNCVMTANTAYDGAGAYAEPSAPLTSKFVRCVFRGNSAGRSGGGIRGGDVTLSNCTVAGNTSAGGGGVNGVSRMYDCLITGNYSSGDGGGYYSNTANKYAYRCAISGNSCGAYGGGAYNGSYYHCVITGNSAPMGAGTFWSIDLDNCLVAGNQGQGVNSPNFMRNCTVVGNIRGTQLGGFTSVNCVVYYNETNYTTVDTFINSCTFPGPAGANNTTNAPLFAGQGSGYGTNLVFGNYRLTKNSPCVNSGVNYGWMTDPNDSHGRNMDLDGYPRVQLGTSDIGAYEFIPAGSVFILRGQ